MARAPLVAFAVLALVMVAAPVSAGPPSLPVQVTCTQFTDASCDGSACYRILNTPDLCLRRVP